MQIRLAAPIELPLIAMLDKRSNKTPWDMLQYEECLASIEQKIYVLEIDSIICGILAISVIFDQVDILQLVISNEYQNKKLATYLLSEVMKRLDEKNPIAKVLLEVRRDNDPAIALYKKLGFTQIATRKDYYDVEGNKIDALVMMLDYAKS